MGQYAGQIFLGSNHHAVEIVMEVLLDITFAVLSTLHKRDETGKTLGRLHTTQEEAVVAENRNLAHLQLTDIIAEGKFAIIQISEQLGIFLLGKLHCPNKVRHHLVHNPALRLFHELVPSKAEDAVGLSVRASCHLTLISRSHIVTTIVFAFSLLAVQIAV